MPEWEFRDPWFFVLLPLVPLAFWLAGKDMSRVSFSSLSLVVPTPRSLRLRLSALPRVLIAAALALLILALARPRTPEKETRVSRDGIAIMMVVDLSSSMDARDLDEDDINVNRLNVVQDVFTEFVLGDEDQTLVGRPDDLIGLVTFAGYADSVCPLTLDHGNLASIVQDLEIVDNRQDDGTAVGDGLGLAVERLRRSEAKSRIAIVLTDGVNNAGFIDPERAAELAAEFDIKVYCIGAGTNGVAPIPTTDIFGRRTLIGQQVRIDEDMLRSIADRTGGEYFRAVDRDNLKQIYARIDQLEKTKVSETRYLKYDEHFMWFLLAGLICFSASALLEASLFRSLP